MTLGAFAYRDVATYWPAPTETGYGGVEFDAPRILMTKWEDSIEEFTDLNGSANISRSIVYVMEDVEEGGYLAFGDFVATPIADPTTIKEAWFIKRVDKTRDLRGLHEEIRAYL